MIQGIGGGGEWGGSVLLAMEWARSWYSGDQFLVCGWRIPFFLSAIMGGRPVDPPWHHGNPGVPAHPGRERAARVPVLEVPRRQPKQIILTALLRLPEQAPGYIVGTFVRLGVIS